MSESQLSAEALTRVLLEEADAIDDLTDAIAEQRESVKMGDHLLLQDQMKCIQDLFFRVQTQEAQRLRLTEPVAKKLGCEAHLSAMAAAMPAAERALFRGAGERLGYAVLALKSEMAILSGLIEHNERFSAMLLSEWRRLEGGFTRPAGLDFKG
ncbi:MAG: hypothetical protein LBQ90_10025 [Synergistaceae bacterium]|nr:hypothetical protein [Synergistaceae bacterium]